ncbi:MAG: type III-A CRISPR-associated RAMP protein Csm3 [Magnetococcus sp. DMHC-1]
MQLTDIRKITGFIEISTGLHIGSGNTEMHIGGSDNPVIKHPHTNQPYIPGSSLKGKIRSLLEWRSGLAAVNGGSPVGYKFYDQCEDPGEKSSALLIIKLFGVSGGDELTKEQALTVGPSRLIFRDCLLDEDWVKKITGKSLPLTEIKMENTIDRVRGVAEHPRNVERVPAGARFNFEVAIKILDTEKEEEMLTTLFDGLKLLEMDSLGGSGSRGYGRIAFTLTSKDYQEKLNNAKPFEKAGK